MKLYICSSCQQHFVDKSCPHCSDRPSKSSLNIALAMLLGLGLTGCGEKEEEDTGDSNTEEPTAEPDAAALYGVEEG